MNFPLRLHRLLPALAILAGLSSSLGGPTLGSEVKVKQWGYAIKTVDGWKSITPETDEKRVVGKWKPDLSEAMKRGDYDGYSTGQVCNLSIVRVALESGTTESTATPAAASDADEKRRDRAKELSKDLLGYDHEKKTNPKSMQDWIEGNFGSDILKRAVKKEVKAGKLTGTLYEFGESATRVVISIFAKDATEWGVVYTSHEEAYKKTWAEVYLKSIQSFRLFEPEGKPDAAVANADLNKLTGKSKRDAIAATIAGLPGWYAVNTKNYVFLSNCKDKAYIELLSKEIEVIRAKVYEKLFPPQTQTESISIVRILGTQEEYHQFGGPGGSAGYFSPRTEELVLFTEFAQVTKKNSRAYCKSVMYHEAFHQYIHFAAGKISPHSWFNEGHGDFFAGAIVTGGNVKFEPFDWRVDFLKQHLRSKNDLIPLRSLVRYPQSEYYVNGGLKYSQGWAFIYWLRQVNKNKRYTESLDIYFKHLSENIAAFRKKDDGKDDPLGGGAVDGIPGLATESFEDMKRAKMVLDEAVDKAFEGIDMEKMDAEFLAWVKTL